VSRYFVLISIGLSFLLSAISNTSVAVAFPVITTSFDVSLVVAGWVLTIYQVVATAAMPLAGKAGDVYGNRAIFLWALVLFISGSLICALAPNIEVLIMGRFIQALGGAGFMPVATGIVAETYPQSRQQLIGLFTSIFPIGQIIGPNLGGWLVSAYGWRSIFWLNVPLGIIVLVISMMLIKKGRGLGGSVDLKGTALFTLSLFSILIGLSTISQTETASWWVVTGFLIASGIVLMYIFIRHLKHAKDPIIDREMLSGRAFMAANIYNFVFGACILGVVSFVPLYAVELYGLNVLQSGLVLTPRSLGMAVMSAFTAFSMVRWGYRKPIIIGSIGMMLSMILLGLRLPPLNLFGMEYGGMVIIMLIMLLMGVGMGFAAPASNNVCIELMPDRVASITGVRGMFRQSGGALSIAITSLLLNNVGNIGQGFTIAFWGFTLAMLAVFPFIFAIPDASLLDDSKQKG
jgi:EmrB/QacA subfamily drug resistance transporter